MLNPRLIIPSSFKQCFTYEQQILFLLNWINDISEKIGDGPNSEIEKMKEELIQLQATLATLEETLNTTTTVTDELAESVANVEGDITVIYTKIEDIER